MKRWNCIFALALSISLLNVAHAGKPDKPGGKDDPEPSPVIELSPFEGNVFDINQEQGGTVEAVGYVQTAAGYPPEAFYSKIDNAGNVLDSARLDFSVPEGFIAEGSWALGINQPGAVVGVVFGHDDAGQLHRWPSLWADSISSAFFLPLPEGFEAYHGQADSINAEGIVIGQIWKVAASIERAVIAWKLDLSGENPVGEASQTFLHSTSDGAVGDPLGKITDLGLGVATVKDVSGYHSYRLLLDFNESDGGELTVTTQSLLSFFPEPAEAYPYAVNDFGTLGGTILTGGNSEAFAIDYEGISLPLQELPPAREKGVSLEYRNRRVNAINNLGIKVGMVIGITTKYGTLWGEYPVTWGADGAVSQLHEDWDWAADINDAGWIGGHSRNNCPAIELP